MRSHDRRYSFPRSLAAPGGLLRSSPALVPQLLVVAALLALAAADGGYATTAWYPAALFAAAMLAVCLLVLPGAGRHSRAALIALLLLAAYAAWSYLSITWAGSPADAWDGANRAALYAVLFAQFSLWPSRPRATCVLVAAVGLGIAALGVVELLRADASATPARFFYEARFIEPVGYINGNVALWSIGLMACLASAAASGLPSIVRGLGLGGAQLLAALSLLGQSRGWALALPLALLLLVLISPARLRIVVAAVLAGGGTAVSAGTVLAVHDRFEPAVLDAALADATVLVLGVSLVLAVLGSLLARATRRVGTGGRGIRRLELGLGALLLLALVGGTVALSLGARGPVDRADEAWREFKAGEETPGPGSSRFTTGGTNRYDFWTVAVEVAGDHPVGGVGADNFQAEYMRRGNSGEQPRFAHSLQLGILAQTGFVGGLLLVAAAGFALAAALATRRGAPGGGATGAAALGVAGYWVLHASVDWLWEFPALAGVAFAMLGLATATGPPADARRSPDGRGRRLLQPAACALVVLVLLSFALPWLAARGVERAASEWRDDPARAFARLRDAESVNPLSVRAQVTAGSIALELGDSAAARREFAKAAEREPENPYALLELALLRAEAGDRRRAIQGLEAVLRLTPRDEPVREALARVSAGEQISAKQVNEEILEEALKRGDELAGGSG